MTRREPPDQHDDPNSPNNPNSDQGHPPDHEFDQRGPDPMWAWGRDRHPRHTRHDHAHDKRKRDHHDQHDPHDHRGHRDHNEQWEQLQQKLRQKWHQGWQNDWQNDWQQRIYRHLQNRLERSQRRKQNHDEPFPPNRPADGMQIPGMPGNFGDNMGSDMGDGGDRRTIPRGWPRQPFDPRFDPRINPNSQFDPRFGPRYNPDWRPPPGWRPPPEFSRDYARELRQNPEWTRRQRQLFGRFVMTFGLFMLIIVGGVGMLAWLFTHLFGGNGQAALLTWLGGCGIVVLMPILGITVAIRASRDITNPLADVITAADSIAKGDLTVRVRENAPGEFGRLTQTFNRMVSELQRIDEQRKNLTADVAHELRTPLHIIQGNLEGLLDGVYQPTKEHIQMLLEETQLLARLIDDLRTLAQAEAGHLPLHKEPVRVAELLTDLGTSFSVQAESAGIALKVDVQPLMSTIVEADVQRLNQVFANLIVNAIRHTPQGGKITLSAQAIPGGARLSVSDTGQGIASDDLPHIFDRFWRGDTARTHKDGAGGGLGLAIVKQLVELHGGEISVQSFLGQGTIFTVDLPERLPDPQPAAQ